MDAITTIPAFGSKITFAVKIPAGQWLVGFTTPERSIVRLEGVLRTGTNDMTVERYFVRKNKDGRWSKAPPSYLDHKSFSRLPEYVQTSILLALTDEVEGLGNALDTARKKVEAL